MAERTTKKGAERSQPPTQAAKADKPARDAPHGAHEEAKVDYKQGTVRLSAGLAETVAGMLISAVYGNAAHQKMVKDTPRSTREYERFAEMKHPKEVQQWVLENFQNGGPGLAAIESQMEIYVDELATWMDTALRYHKGHWCAPFCDCVQYPQQCRPP
jgi:hypothetical protein